MDHSHQHEVLFDMIRVVKQYKLWESIYKGTTLKGVHKTEGDSWRALGTCCDQAFRIECQSVALCINRRLGAPSFLPIPNESVYRGHLLRGLGGDARDAYWAEKQVGILGMGPFATEFMRTALERSAAFVFFLCRRRGLAFPHVADWLALLRPLDKDFKRGRKGDVIILQIWQKAYDSARAARPEYWASGVVKPDGVSASVTDLYFVAHHLERATSKLGQVASFTPNLPPSVLTKDGEELPADIFIKCHGFEKTSAELIMGRSRTRAIGLVEQNLWLVTEGILDENWLNTPFGSSWGSYAHFLSKCYVRYYKDQRLQAKILAADRLPRLNIDDITATQIFESVKAAMVDDPYLDRAVREHHKTT